MKLPSLLHNRRLILLFAGVALLVAIAVWPKAIEVDLARVERGPLVVTVDEEGETRVRHRFVVSAPVAGRLLRIDLEPGDSVVGERTVLATLLPADPTPLDARSRAEAEAAVEAARAALEAARAEADRAKAADGLARSQLARYRQLAADGLASPETLEQREAEAQSSAEASRAAEFAAAAAAAELAAAHARLQRPGAAARGRAFELHSPIDGVVLRRLRESESVVPAGQPLLEIGDPAELEIVADYLSSDAARIEPQDVAWIEQWGGDTPLRGKVRRVEPSGFTKISALGVEEQRVNVIVDFVDPVPVGKLGDGFRVELRVVVWEAADVLKVPSSALFRSAGRWAVFTVETGRAHLRAIEIGQRNADAAEVLSGLVAGAEVITYPSDTIADGAKVTRRKG